MTWQTTVVRKDYNKPYRLMLLISTGGGHNSANSLVVLMGQFLVIETQPGTQIGLGQGKALFYCRQPWVCVSICLIPE